MKSFLLKTWKFHYKDCPEAWYKGYPDEDWETVTVPHDWSVHMPFSREYSSGTGYLAGGTGWYRTTFTLPKEAKGKKIFICFDGVYKNSQVWCNSYYLGKRPSGYATFRYDITEQAVFGDLQNEISVKVSHPDIADSRWFTGSGITRKVTVQIEEMVHPDFNGIFFKTPVVSKEKAEIEIVNSIVNEADRDLFVTVTSRLSKVKDVLAMENTAFISAGSSADIRTQGTLLNPVLWSTSSPSLYELKTTVTAKDIQGNTYAPDESLQMAGFRNFRFDADKGFFLNESPMKLKGVCVHHDAGCLGAAVYKEIWQRRLEKLKEIGCNAIRMSHNPHMPELYDLCDSLGFLVMDEAFDEWEGVKNKWSTGHNVYPPKHQGYFEDFTEWHEKDLTDFVKRDRNHPSIIIWSIGNEIDYPNDPYCHPLFSNMTGNNDKNKPEVERQYDPDKPNAERLAVLAAKLTGLVKNSDTTRPVTAAVAFPELSTRIGYIDTFDVVGYNYKEQYYKEDHIRFPKKPFLGSENSHSYQAWKAARDFEYISGQFLWTGIDYLGEAHGWPVRGSGAGLLTTAGFPKSGYYLRKSYWTDTPCIYLVTARSENHAEWEEDPEWKRMYRTWNYAPGEIIEVRCYTNLPYARLLCKDTDYGIRQADDKTGYLTWMVPYEHNELKVMGFQDKNAIKESAADLLKPTGAACCIMLNQWKPLERTDIKQIEVTITDGAGNPVTNDSSMLYVEVTEGTLIGLENGDLSDCTEYTLSRRRAYEGKLIIYMTVRDNSKSAIVTVHGESLKLAVLEIPAVSAPAF